MNNPNTVNIVMNLVLGGIFIFLALYRGPNPIIIFFAVVCTFIGLRLVYMRIRMKQAGDEDRGQIE